LARVARDVRDLLTKTPHLEGIRLVVDGETGMPGSLSEIMVRSYTRCSLIVVFIFILRLNLIISLGFGCLFHILSLSNLPVPPLG
jgi:hypothetical protein